MNAKPRTAGEMNARMSQIGEIFAKSGIAELLPNFRALNNELRDLIAEYPGALIRESKQPSKETLRQIRDADERSARIKKALEEAAQ